MCFLSQILDKLNDPFAYISPNSHFVPQSNLAEYLFLTTVVQLLDVVPEWG